MQFPPPSADKGEPDPATFAAAGLFLAAAALAATYLPVRRASRTDPMVALRCQYAPQRGIGD